MAKVQFRVLTNPPASQNLGNGRAIIIFDTRYGSTEKIARSLETGLKKAGIQTVCTNARETNPESLKEYDLICIGAPTEAFSASRPIKEFLSKLKGANLSGKHGYAFDTKIDSRLSGSAAKYIEKELSNLGLQMVAARESAIVFSLRSGGAISGANLKEGEEMRFEDIGLRVGTESVSAIMR